MDKEGCFLSYPCSSVAKLLFLVSINFKPKFEIYFSPDAGAAIGLIVHGDCNVLHGLIIGASGAICQGASSGKPHPGEQYGIFGHVAGVVADNRGDDAAGFF